MRFVAGCALAAAVAMTAPARAQTNAIAPSPPPGIMAPAQPLTPPQVLTPGAPPVSGLMPSGPPAGGAVPIVEPDFPPSQDGADADVQDQPETPPAADQDPSDATVTPPETAQTPSSLSPPNPPPPNLWLPRQRAIIGVLDKEDGAVSRLAVQVGNSTVQGKLRIKVLACVVRPDTTAPDAAMFLSVQNIPRNQQQTSFQADDDTPAAPIFTGWLLRSEPGASVVSDATDTFRLIGCDAS